MLHRRRRSRRHDAGISAGTKSRKKSACFSSTTVSTPATPEGPVDIRADLTVGCDGRLPLFVRVVNAIPWLQGITARFVALGVRPEHVHSPQAAG